MAPGLLAEGAPMLSESVPPLLTAAGGSLF